LQDPAYAVAVRDLWHDWQTRKTAFSSVAEWWDKGKGELKKLTRTYSRQKAKAAGNTLHSLYKRLRNAQKQGKPRLIVSLKARIQEIEISKARGHFLSRKLDWVQKGEKCTREREREKNVAT